MSAEKKLQASDIRACFVKQKPRPGSIHVETPAAVYHYTLRKQVDYDGWIMTLYPCDCPTEAPGHVCEGGGDQCSVCGERFS